jgi:hypothetical protein
LYCAYRATPNESTGHTPNLLLFGREIRMPYEIVKEGISFGLEENSKNWGEHACSGFSYFKKFT